MKREDYITMLKDRLVCLGNQAESEDEQIADLRHRFDDEGYEAEQDIIEIDEEIIKRAEEIGEFVHDEGHYEQEMKDKWVWNLGLISEGKFLVEKIPKHISVIANELFY